MHIASRALFGAFAFKRTGASFEHTSSEREVGYRDEFTIFHGPHDLFDPRRWASGSEKGFHVHIHKITRQQGGPWFVRPWYDHSSFHVNLASNGKGKTSQSKIEAQIALRTLCFSLALPPPAHPECSFSPDPKTQGLHSNHPTLIDPSSMSCGQARLHHDSRDKNHVTAIPSLKHKRTKARARTDRMNKNGRMVQPRKGRSQRIRSMAPCEALPAVHPPPP